MTTATFTLASLHVKAGENVSPAEQIDPNGVGYAQTLIRVDTTPWTAADTLTLSTQWSPDGGLTWYQGPAATFHGGVQTAKGGGQTALAGVGGSLPSACVPTTARTRGRAYLLAPSVGPNAAGTANMVVTQAITNAVAGNTYVLTVLYTPSPPSPAGEKLPLVLRFQVTE